MAREKFVFFLVLELSKPQSDSNCCTFNAAHLYHWQERRAYTSHGQNGTVSTVSLDKKKKRGRVIVVVFSFWVELLHSQDPVVHLTSHLAQLYSSDNCTKSTKYKD